MREIIFKNNKVYIDNQLVGNLIYKFENDKSIHIIWIENKGFDGFGRVVIKKLFDLTDKIIGDSTSEAIGFWQKIGADLLDPKRISGGVGSRFILTKNKFLEVNL